MDGDSNDEITEFLKKAQEIRIAIDVMKRNTEEVKKLYSIMLSLPHGNDHNNSEVEDRKMVISQTATQIRKRLKEIENDMPEDEDDEDQSQLSRIKRIQFPTLVCLFAETVKEYYEVLSKYQERYKAMVCQQLKINNIFLTVDKSATDEELQDLLDKEGTALFVDNIVADTLQAQQLLANVKERHEDLLKIENSVREVRDMFVQMATLMETQVG
ncbi:Syntaxin-1A [Blattella germanica]|nr:Syntaxin-1A [Blattella germanica]